MLLFGEYFFSNDSSETIKAPRTKRILSGNDFILNEIRIYSIAKKKTTTTNSDGNITTSESIMQSLDVEVNGKEFRALRMWTEEETQISEYSIYIAGTVRLLPNEELVLKILTYSQSYKLPGNDSVTITDSVKMCFSGQNSTRGFYAPSGFFTSVIECTSCINSWQERTADYPYIFSPEYRDYYNTYNLPYRFKYKIVNTINDGYAFIRKIQSWDFAYAFFRQSAWKQAAMYIRTDGTWKKSNPMLYDAKSSMYKAPVIKCAWHVDVMKNSGYPYTVYEDIPYYEEE